MKYAICLCLLAATLGAETPERCVTSIGIPAYPRLAEQARIECTVKVGITIDEAGAVVTATGVSGHQFSKRRQWKMLDLAFHSD